MTLEIFPTCDSFHNSEGMTFQRGLTRWLVFASMGKAASTRHYYREIVKALRRHWREMLRRPVTDLTEDEILRLAPRVAHYSPSRWNAMLTTLRWITPNGRILSRRAIKLTRPPPPNQQEFSALLKASDQLTRSQARLVIDFLAHTGLRITAARNVRWSDVYSDRVEYIAKGGRRCAVPIVNGLRSVLDRLREIGDGSPYVLPRESCRRGLAKACALAGVRRLTHHDFRHMFITRCIESGVDVPTVARWAGHGDGGALLSRRYFHLLDNHSRAMAARVSI
jgi:integrase